MALGTDATLVVATPLPSTTDTAIGPQRVPSEAVRGFQEKALSANTRAAYASDWAHFASWCQRLGLVPLPADPLVVAEYLADLAQLIDDGTGKNSYAPATLQRRVAAINCAHAKERHLSPGSHPDVASTLAGIRHDRALHRPTRRVRPLTLDLLRRALGAIDLTTYPDAIIGRRDAAILVLGFAGAFRASELSALRPSQVDLVPERGLRARVLTSKTDQDGSVGLLKAMPYGSSPLTCPPCAYIRWLQVLAVRDSRVETLRLLTASGDLRHVCHDPMPPTADNLPVLRALRAGGVITDRPASRWTINAVVKARLEAIGERGDAYGSHSMRAGFVTEARRHHAPTHEIQRQTGHADPKTVEIYDREHDPETGNAVTRIRL